MVALKRPTDYSDVHPELVGCDALREGWRWTLVHDTGPEVIVTLDRPEGYERAAPGSVAADAVAATWPSWRVIQAATTDFVSAGGGPS